MRIGLSSSIRCWMWVAMLKEPSSEPPESAAVRATHAVRETAAAAAVAAVRHLRRVREDIGAPWVCEVRVRGGEGGGGSAAWEEWGEGSGVGNARGPEAAGSGGQARDLRLRCQVS